MSLKNILSQSPVSFHYYWNNDARIGEGCRRVDPALFSLAFHDGSDWDQAPDFSLPIDNVRALGKPVL